MKTKSFVFPLAMTARRYRRISEPIRRVKWRYRLLVWSNRICASIFYIAYPIFLIALFGAQNMFVFSAIAIPGVSFILLSILRRVLNRPRPYEKLNIQPLLAKESSGSSFPSRHIFSAFIIAATLSVLNPWGYLLYIPATLLAVIRVWGGVHYPSDVIAGAGFALLVSLCYYI